MMRTVYNNRKPYLCIDCGASVKRRRKRCPDCAKIALKNRPTYERTPEHRELMSNRTKGKPKNYPTGGSDPVVAEKIRQAWTPEMREAARRRGLANAQDQEWRLSCGSSGPDNPMWEDGRAVLPYGSGWTWETKKPAWERAGYRCEICQSDKPTDTHHIDFGKDNHALDNLQVLCRKCHKQLHVAHLNNKNHRD